MTTFFAEFLLPFKLGLQGTMGCSAKIEPKHCSQQPLLAVVEMNVHNFGVLILEVISGKLPQLEKNGDILNWVKQFLNDKTTIAKLVDPTLESYNDIKVDAVCEAI